MFLGLFQDLWLYETLRLSLLMVELSVVVMNTDSQSRRSQIESYG